MSDRPNHLTAMTESWAELTGSAVEATVAANAAALEAMTAVAADDSSRPEETAADPTPGIPESERRAGSAPGALYETDDWSVERSVSEPPAVGDSVRFEKTVTDGDVREFAAVTGDTNRLHLDDSYAAESRFGGRIVHGGLVSALISAALARLPGVVIYLSQEQSFLGPVEVGDRPKATVEVVEELGDDRYRLETVVEVDGEVVVDGEATVLVEDPPE